ncbi:MAG: terpene cyclase/mutase family protein [Planctomycetes bacterium]|nr:terpene cyclase/mutase family protein [Planctomycetota bacterium]
MKCRLAAVLFAAVALPIVLVNPSQSGQNDLGPNAKDVREVLDKALAFLKSSQGSDGSFSPKLAGPGITAVVVAGLAKNGVSPKEPVMAKALEYLEKQVNKDGGIYNKFLANYTTSVALMAFKETNADGKYDGIIKNASNFLKGLQQETEQSDVKHGGFGYDKKSRPDLSNTGFTVEALIAAGIPKDDPAIKKAIQFMSRCQNLPGETNDQPFAKKTTKEDEGGFTYHPFEDDKNQYKTEAGGLRSLGGMTYGGLKSFLYAGVSKDDPRVKAAIGWIRRHYTLDENPGMGKAGLYYYYHTFAKAMDALGEERFAGNDGKKHDWRRELFEALKNRQSANGSWRNTGEKTFAEDNPDLATGFAVMSLSYTLKKR